MPLARMMQEQESIFPLPFHNLAIQIAQYQIPSISHAGQSMTMISSKNKRVYCSSTRFISTSVMLYWSAKEEGI